MMVNNSRSTGTKVLIAVLIALAVFSPDVLAQTSSLPAFERGLGWVLGIFSPGVIITLGTLAFIAIGLLFLSGRLELRGAAICVIGVIIVSSAPWIARTLFYLSNGG